LGYEFGFCLVLSNGGYSGAMAVWRGGFLKKRHQRALALRVSNGGAMATAIGLTVVAELWQKKLLFFLKIFPKLQIGSSWADPTQP